MVHTMNLANQCKFTKVYLSIYPNKCLFYDDVKQFAKVYFINAVFSENSSKFPVLWYIFGSLYILFVVECLLTKYNC